MLRAILIILAASGCALMGVLACDKLKKRHDTLNAMLSSIMELNMCMQYSPRPLADLVRSCKKKETEPFYDAFIKELERKNVHQAWISAMDYARLTSPDFAALEKEELCILEEYAVGLGAGNLKTQAKNAAILEKRMEPVVLSCMQAYTHKGRIYKSMGVLSGLAVAILLF